MVGCSNLHAGGPANRRDARRLSSIAPGLPGRDSQQPQDQTAHATTRLKHTDRDTANRDTVTAPHTGRLPLNICSKSVAVNTLVEQQQRQILATIQRSAATLWWCQPALFILPGSNHTPQTNRKQEKIGVQHRTVVQHKAESLENQFSTTALSNRNRTGYTAAEHTEHRLLTHTHMVGQGGA